MLLGVICTAVSYLLWYQALKEVEAAEAGAAILVTPVLLTSLIGLEKRVGFIGTNPMVITPVIIGSLLAVSGVYVTWAKWMRNEQEAETLTAISSKFDLFKRLLVFFAASGLFLGAIAFFLPVEVNNLQGILLNDAIYESQWQTKAYETVGGYLILFLGTSNLVASLRYLRGKFRILQLLGWSALSGLFLVSALLAGDTVFFSWVPWIPPEIQHAIGTEYVRIWQVSVTNIPMVLSTISGAIYILISAGLAIVSKVKSEK